MTEKVRLRLPAHIAARIRPEAPLDQRLAAARGELELPPGELLICLVILAGDGEAAVRAAAVATLKSLEEPLVAEVLGLPEMNPKILHVLARLHGGKGEIARLVASHPLVEPETLEYLKLGGPLTPAPQDASTPIHQEAECGGDQVDPSDPDEEEYRSKYQLAQEMGISDKIKFALTGDKEWRSLFLKDSNKLVSGAVLKNPRITDQEIVSIAKSTMINEEAVRLICANKDWVKNYLIRKALVENPKTPLPIALRFLSTMTEKDLAMMSKSKNVSSVIATQARKALAVIQKRR